MVAKFYNGVIEQVYEQVGKTDKNIVMACYNNDFSVENLENIKRYSEQEDNVFFAWHQFEYGFLANSFEPFLGVICELYRKHINGDFDLFLEECDVYQLQREVFRSYYYTGVCVRNEDVLLDEVNYERRRMVQGMATMLVRLAEFQPIVLVINRFQIASESTLVLVRYLIEHPTKRIGIVLGTNESQRKDEYNVRVWDEIISGLIDNNLVYHIGTTGIFLNSETGINDLSEVDLEVLYRRVSNNMALMDYKQVHEFLQIQYRKFSSDLFENDRATYVRFMNQYVKSAILCGNLSKGLELIARTLRYDIGEEQHMLKYQCAYNAGVCYMYQEKLGEAIVQAERALQEAKLIGDEFLIFKAELLRVQSEMSGWSNIFFMVKDVAIRDSLLEKLERYHYKNHLAHVDIFAYDNEPEELAKAYREEVALIHFGKGIAIAKELDNEQLLYKAYQKNIMIASTNGMNEIAILYAVRMYQTTKVKKSIRTVRVFAALGYNLNAMGYAELAEQYYYRAIELLYELREPVDIAEAYYNLGLNYIMQEDYERAGQAFNRTLKVIECLHLNSLRVCNLSKLYGLFAVVSVFQNQQFNSERYLKSCGQFLNYVLEKEGDYDEEIVHDYKMFDDDLFLYNFAKGRLHQIREEYDEALACYEKAEKHLMKAEGNQFYAYNQFRKSRIELFETLGLSERYHMEKHALEQHINKRKAVQENTSIDIIREIDCGEMTGQCRVEDAELDLLLKQAGFEVDYQMSQKHLEYLSDWQKMMAQYVDDQNGLINAAIWNFLNHFGNDGLVYIRYQEEGNEIFFNSTEIYFDDAVMEGVRGAIRNYPEGFAVSKISENFYEHLNMISYFDVNEICSLAAVPCYENEKLQAVFITFVRMKENWHSVVNHYMLDELDLGIYSLLFRELNTFVNQILARNQIKEMNQKLEQNVVTDMLTGLYNRAGMYREVDKLEQEISEGQGMDLGVGIMFLDLDNFKPYNDTFGHDIGDVVLQGMASIFRDAVGETGVVCRFGGDEFIIILRTGDKDTLENCAKTIFQKIKEADGFRSVIQNKMGRTIDMNESTYIGCSMGIAMSELEGDHTIDELIKRADDVLYEVKTKSKGTYAFI